MTTGLSEAPGPAAGAPPVCWRPGSEPAVFDPVGISAYAARIREPVYVIGGASGYGLAVGGTLGPGEGHPLVGLAPPVYPERLGDRGFAEAHGIDMARSYFYTDSYSDVPMLLEVGEPRVINPDPRLRRWAAQRGLRWETWSPAARTHEGTKPVGEADAVVPRQRLESREDLEALLDMRKGES